MTRNRRERAVLLLGIVVTAILLAAYLIPSTPHWPFGAYQATLYGLIWAALALLIAWIFMGPFQAVLRHSRQYPRKRPSLRERLRSLERAHQS